MTNFVYTTNPTDPKEVIFGTFIIEGGVMVWKGEKFHNLADRIGSSFKTMAPAAGLVVFFSHFIGKFF